MNPLKTTVTKSFSVLALSLALASIASAQASDLAAGTYKVDADHSKIGFGISHLVISTVDGRFGAFEGEFTAGKKPADLTISASIDVASIDTGVKKRDDHLKSPDFFDAAKFPKITFKSKKVTGAYGKLKVVGDLTIRDVTKEVTLDAQYTGSAKDPWGNDRAAFKAEGKINRRDFGLNYGALTEKTPAVGNEVALHLSVEGIKAK